MHHQTGATPTGRRLRVIINRQGHHFPAQTDKLVKDLMLKAQVLPCEQPVEIQNLPARDHAADSAGGEISRFGHPALVFWQATLHSLPVLSCIALASI
jgi:hypothetical protein